MSYTIISAAYCNPDATAAIIETVEDSAVAISAQDSPDDWADFQNWISEENVPAPYVPGLRSVESDAFFRTLYEKGEYGAFQTWLSSQSDAVKFYFNNERRFEEDDPNVTAVMTALGLTAGGFYDDALT